MAFSLDSVKLRSLGLCTAVLTAAAFGFGGCLFVEDNGHEDPGGYQEPPPDTVEPMLVSIDTDATISASPGEGVGLFVEYAAGGTWRLWTTCDTNYSSVACNFDIFAAVDADSELLDIRGDELEGNDEVGPWDVGVAFFHAETDSDVDSMTLATTPGAIVEVAIYLDSYSQPRFVYWFGDGVLHEGAPTNPVDFEPVAP